MLISSRAIRATILAVAVLTTCVAQARSDLMKRVDLISLAGRTLKVQSLCGWVGVRVSPMTTQFADSLGMVEPYGAIFDRPEPGSPAANAGIEPGDVITAISGSPLTDSSDFATIISAMAPGSMVYLITFRNGQMIEVRLVLGSSTCPDERHGATTALRPEIFGGS
jgi:predicted metalloprotease with PDZ domain